MWKGGTSGNGLYPAETTLTPQNVNEDQFGKLATFHVQGLVVAQPLYVQSVDMGAQGTHNIIIIVTEHLEVVAFDADSRTDTPLWTRSYIAPGIMPAPDNYGGRSTFAGEIGITATPVIDPTTGTMYFVTMLSNNGIIQQWLRSIDIKTGLDVGPGSVQIEAMVPGDGPGCRNGQCPFDPLLQNQRSGLSLLNGNIIIAWGSFSDWGVYRGWIMAYDELTLMQKAAYSPATQYQQDDDANGPADHGGGAAIWSAGAPPAIDADGNIFLSTADGSFNADQGGRNYGDSVIKLQIAGTTFTPADYFSPSNRACIDAADLETGSGGVLILPTDATGGVARIITLSKEGRLYLLDPANLGHTTSDDSQIPQRFTVGAHECVPGMGGGQAEGPDWNRLYANASYWNGSVYIAPSNTTLRQYRFAGSVLDTTPASQSTTLYGLRGGNTVVSANVNSNGIVWAANKHQDTGVEEVYAYDATDVSRQLWSNTTNPGRDGVFAGTGFAVPVVANGKIIVAGNGQVNVFGLLQ